jgi:hypothetical protein
MHIASVMTDRAIAMHAAADPAPPVPARAVYDRYIGDLFSMPGAQRIGWSRSAPDEIHLVFATDGFRRLADNVLRDAIDGVRLVMSVDPAAPAPVPGGDAWADNPTEMARVVTSMPGVVGASSSSEHGLHELTFTAYEPSVAARLKPLVNDSFGRYRVLFWTRSLPKPPAP